MTLKENPKTNLIIGHIGLVQAYNFLIWGKLMRANELQGCSYGTKDFNVMQMQILSKFCKTEGIKFGELE